MKEVLVLQSQKEKKRTKRRLIWWIILPRQAKGCSSNGTIHRTII
jgi:hypothetical protein